MDETKIRLTLPEGFSLQNIKGKICVFGESWRREMLSLAAETDPARRAIRHLRGRGRPAVVEAGESTLVVRHYYHGGALRKLTGDLFPGPRRFLNELRLLAAARRAGVAVPEPVGVLIEPVFGFLARCDLVTAYIPESVDLLSHYRNSLAAAGPGPGSLAAVIASAGRQVASLHRAGISHGDLQFKNILVVPGRLRPRAVILDLDRGRRSPDGKAARVANLARLHRSFLKMRLSLPDVSRYDPIRFLRFYAPRDRNFRRSVVEEIRRRSGRNLLHRWKWKLSFRLGGGYYARSMGRRKK